MTRASIFSSTRTSATTAMPRLHASISPGRLVSSTGSTNKSAPTSAWRLHRKRGTPQKNGGCNRRPPFPLPLVWARPLLFLDIRTLDVIEVGAFDTDQLDRFGPVRRVHVADIVEVCITGHHSIGADGFDPVRGIDAVAALDNLPVGHIGFPDR